MRSTRTRSLAAVAAGVLLLAPLAGCGGDDKDGKAADAKTTSSASSSPSDAETTESSEPATDEAIEGDAAKPGERLTKDNLVATMVAAMRREKTAHMELELGSAVGASADLRYGDSTTDMKMTMDQGSVKITMVLVDGTMYMQQGKGKYLKVDKDDPALGSLVDQIDSMGPEASVTALKDGLQEVEYAGTATVDGDKVSKYRVTVDTAAAADQLGMQSDAAQLPKKLTYEMFVDDDHLMRRVKMTVSGQSLVMTVSDWGEPVEIKAPPASQVQSAP